MRGDEEAEHWAMMEAEQQASSVERLSEEIVNAVLDELSGRSGFDNVISDLDDATMNELFEKCCRVVFELLMPEPPDVSRE